MDVTDEMVECGARASFERSTHLAWDAASPDAQMYARLDARACLDAILGPLNVVPRAELDVMRVERNAERIAANEAIVKAHDAEKRAEAAEARVRELEQGTRVQEPAVSPEQFAALREAVSGIIYSLDTGGWRPDDLVSLRSMLRLAGEL